MKIVVVGGTGLIGTRVVQQLSTTCHDVVTAARATGVNAYTGEGLAEALDHASVVIDVSNSGYLDEAGALEYFEGATLNLLTYGAAAGVRHHVALSVVGTDRLAAGGGGYFTAKRMQEQLIRASTRPFTIVHSTQFYEFIPQIADAAADGHGYAVTQALMQPIAADDTAAAVVRTALEGPSNDTVEHGGPQQGQLAEFVKLWAIHAAPARAVEIDLLARYFGSRLHERDLLPGSDATLSSVRYEDWLADHVPARGGRRELVHVWGHATLAEVES